jgi:hypothetical protein
MASRKLTLSLDRRGFLAASLAAGSVALLGVEPGTKRGAKGLVLEEATVAGLRRGWGRGAGPPWNWCGATRPASARWTRRGPG